MNTSFAPALLALGLPLVLLNADCLPEDLDDPVEEQAPTVAGSAPDAIDAAAPTPSMGPSTSARRVGRTPRLAVAPPPGLVALPVDGCEEPGSGALTTWTDGETWSLPLLHTDIDAHISGVVADVSVVQTFTNPFDHPIEASYVFPLPDDGAVDAMTLRVGRRVIEASVHAREEAEEIYDEARREGRVAARLDQERPNLFKQHVANLLPGAVVEIELHVVQPLQFEEGGYDWAFPLVVGPRFVPGDGDPSAGASTDPGDARAAVNAPYSPTRTGNDVAIEVTLDAGVPLTAVSSPSHDVIVDRPSPSRSRVSLAPHDTIPNKDFVLRYEVGGEEPEVALLVQHDEADSVFMLVIQPPADAFVTDDIVTPKEMVFVVDTSCSMSGYPLDKAKDAMSLAIAGMNPDDRFLVMDFNDEVSQLAPRPLPNTIANRRRGAAFVEAFQGSGGTRMLSGIEASLDLPADEELLRTVVFLTDGYIGNEADILAAIDARLGSRTRLFSLGIGSSVNRYLLDRMAKAGRGDVEYVLHEEAADEAVQGLYERIRNPIVTDLQVDFGGADVHDVYPDPLPDLFAGQPLVLLGRYGAPGPMTVTVTGRTRQGPYEQRVQVVLPADGEDHPGLPSLWARGVVEDLESRNRDGQDPALNEELLDLALGHGLVTRLTSMVAVDSVVSNPGGALHTHDVPLETPQGVDLEAAAGPVGPDGLARPQAPPPACPVYGADDSSMQGYGSGYGSGGGSGYGSGGGYGFGGGGLGVRGVARGGGGAASTLSGHGTTGRATGGAGASIRGTGAPSSPPLRRARSLPTPAPEAVASLEPATRVPAAPAAAADESVVLGSIDKSVIDRVVRQRLQGIRACYQRGLQLRPGLAGRVVARFVIDATGAVTGVEMRSSTLSDPSVEACIAEQLQRMAFPEPAGGGVVVVSYPFVFRSTDED
jgi:Ca-activated chloride channel family protein